MTIETKKPVIVKSVEFSEIPETLREIKGIEALENVKNNITELGKSLGLVVRAVATKAYSTRNAVTASTMLKDLVTYTTTINKNIGAVVKWSYESLCGIEYDKGDKVWLIKCRTYQRQMTANLKDIDLMSSYDQTRKAEKRTKAQAIDESEGFKNHDTMFDMKETLNKLAKDQSKRIEKASAWSESRSTKSDYVAYATLAERNTHAVMQFIEFCQEQNKSPIEIMKMLREINA